MQLKEIKQLVKSLGHAVLVEEDGSGLVVLSLPEYLELIGQQIDNEEGEAAEHNGVALKNGLTWREVPASGMTEQDLLTIEKLNQDIAMLKEEIKKRELEELENDPADVSVDPVRDEQKY